MYYGYGYQGGYYGYGYYGHSYYGYSDSDPIYGYSGSVTDPYTGYTHIHSVYADVDGAYYHTQDEDRGPLMDRSVQTTTSYQSGVYTTDVLSSFTPLDGNYESYGSRYTSSYDLNDHTSTTDQTYFSEGYSFSEFHSQDYATGASVSSYDTRYFYANGYNEYTTSSYNGPGGYTSTSIGGYHYTS